MFIEARNHNLQVSRQTEYFIDLFWVSARGIDSKTTHGCYVTSCAVGSWLETLFSATQCNTTVGDTERAENGWFD